MNPKDEYESIKEYMAFYTWKLDAAYVDDLQVAEVHGDLYGGWRTEDIVGPWNS